mgnify:CR=1 FL=1
MEKKSARTRAFVETAGPVTLKIRRDIKKTSVLCGAHHAFPFRGAAQPRYIRGLHLDPDHVPVVSRPHLPYSDGSHGLLHRVNSRKPFLRDLRPIREA